MFDKDRIDFYDSLAFGKKGEDILKDYLMKELTIAYQNHQINFEDVTQNCICQFAGLDFAIRKKSKSINSLEDLKESVLDAIEIKSHLWVNFDNHIADLAFEVFSDYDRLVVGWVEKTVDIVENNILPFVRIFWINKDNLWVASIQLNKKFCQFWKSNPWNLDHRINKYSYAIGKKWRSSWSPIKVLTLQREGIPYTSFQII